MAGKKNIGSELAGGEKNAIREFFIKKGLPADRAVAFADVALPENYSDIRSRSEIFDFRTRLAPGLALAIPVVSANMESVTGLDLAAALEREARNSVERLKELLPKQQFSQAVQARAMGRIIARETIPAMKKLLGNFDKTGGDRTRKMKLWKKQKRGKEKLQSMARVELSPEVFGEILKK